MTPESLTKNRILVDTDAVSYLFRGDTRAEYFRPYFLHRTLAVSFMTVAELYYGAYKARWGTNRIVQLENHLRNYVVVPYDYGGILRLSPSEHRAEQPLPHRPDMTG